MKIATVGMLILVVIFQSPSAIPTGALPLPPKGKTEKKNALQPHPQSNQDTMDMMGKQGDKDVVIREWDGVLYVEASLIYWESDDRIVSLVLAIKNLENAGPPAPPKPPQQLLVPSTIVVILPNGHSYRPFNQADVLREAYAQENGSISKAYSGYNPPPVTTYNTNCSLNGDTASCQTTADQSVQAGYAVGFALGAAVKSAFARRKAEKYIKQVKEGYLTSQQVPLGSTVVGYVDLYVEDVHSGPFIVRFPAGDKTYDFVFGPEVIVFEVPKER